VLVVNRKLRVANDVDEQDMGDFELDLFLNFGGHKARRKGRITDGQLNVEHD